MSKKKMREEFEAWWSSEMNVTEMDLHRCDFPMQKADFVQPYACHETQRGWMAWQASRAMGIDLVSETNKESVRAVAIDLMTCDVADLPEAYVLSMKPVDYTSIAERLLALGYRKVVKP